MKRKRKKEKISVDYSKSHRRKGHWRKGHNVNYSKPHRNKSYTRNPRSTEEEIKRRGGTRKEVRAKQKKEKYKKFAKERNRPAKRSLKKKENDSSKQKTISSKEPRNRPAKRSLKKKENDSSKQTKLVN